MQNFFVRVQGHGKLETYDLPAPLHSFLQWCLFFWVPTRIFFCLIHIILLGWLSSSVFWQFAWPEFASSSCDPLCITVKEMLCSQIAEARKKYFCSSFVVFGRRLSSKAALAAAAAMNYFRASDLSRDRRHFEMRSHRRPFNRAVRALLNQNTKGFWRSRCHVDPMDLENILSFKKIAETVGYLIAK